MAYQPDIKKGGIYPALQFIGAINAPTPPPVTLLRKKCP